MTTCKYGVELNPDWWRPHWDYCGGCCRELLKRYGEILMDDNSGKLTADAKERKDIPMARGLLDYFPDALAEVAHTSQVGNDQHNPGEDLHWDRDKSTDHADCILRHLVDRGMLDSDGIRHTAKVAWRALALLQVEIEEAKLSEFDRSLNDIILKDPRGDADEIIPCPW